MAQGLLEYETLTGDEIEKVIKGQKLGDDDDNETPKPTAKPSLAAVPKTTRKPKKPRDPGMEPEPNT